MTLFVRVCSAAVIDTVIFFIFLLALITAGAPASNGFFGFSAFGVGLMVSIPASIFVALPSGIILGLLLGKIVRRVLTVIAGSALTAFAVMAVWSFLAYIGPSGSSDFIGSPPFFAALVVCFLSNLVTILVLDRIFRRTFVPVYQGPIR